MPKSRKQHAGMRLALASGMLLAFCASACAQTCSLQRVAALPMRENPDGFVVVPFTISGAEQSMIVDTGASINTLTLDAVNRLKLTASPMNGVAYGVAGKAMTRLTAADSFVLGQAHGGTIHFVMTDGDAAFDRGGISGGLGSEFLRQFDLDFDFAAKTLNVMSQDHCPGKVVYWAHSFGEVPFDLSPDGLIELPITLDGQTLRAVIDSGATDTVLSTTAAHRYFDIDRDSAKSPTLQMHTLTIGDVTVQNPVLYFVDDKVTHRAFVDFETSGEPVDDNVRLPNLLIGNNILSKLHIYIAYKERKIYVTAAGAH